MEILSLVPDITFGFFIGIAIGMTGIGGGALIQPALIHILGIAPVPAVGTGLLYAMLTKTWGTLSHYRLKTIRVRRAFYFLVGSVPSVLVASSIVNYSFQSFNSPRVNANIQITMAITLLISAAVLLFRAVPSNAKSADVGAERTYLEGDRSPLPPSKKTIAVVAGVLIGSRLTVKLPETVLKILVIVMVAGSGISLLFGIGH